MISKIENIIVTIAVILFLIVAIPFVILAYIFNKARRYLESIIDKSAESEFNKRYK